MGDTRFGAGYGPIVSGTGTTVASANSGVVVSASTGGLTGVPCNASTTSSHTRPLTTANAVKPEVVAFTDPTRSARRSVALPFGGHAETVKMSSSEFLRRVRTDGRNVASSGSALVTATGAAVII